MKAVKCPHLLVLMFLGMTMLISACGGGPTPEIAPLTGLTPPAITVYITDQDCPTVEIETGFTVGWRNAGKKQHILQSELQEDGYRLFDSGVLQPGDGFAMTFMDPGTISYTCSEDGTLQGTITVKGLTPQLTTLTPQVGAGVSHACLLTQPGQVYCWGQGAHPGEEVDPNTWGKPSPVEGLDVISLGAGWYHTCVVTREGLVKCWGQNPNGQLGNGTALESAAPVDVSDLTRVKAIEAGPMHTCALTAEGQVYCWGVNDNGQLGDGTTIDRSTPVQVTGLSGPADSIAAGLLYTCAILVNGQVECWGDFDFINGEQSHKIRTSPTLIPNLEGDIEKLAAGDYHICALTKGHEVKCEGFFFPVSEQPFSKPVEALGELQGHIVDILAETDFTCVVTDSGEVYCWGDNYFDQIGDGTFLTAGEPKKVERAGTDAIALGGGHYTVCALLSEGGITCWGDTSFGQLGDGTARWK